MGRTNVGWVQTFKRSNAQLITVHRDPVSRLEIDHLRPFSVTVR